LELDLISSLEVAETEVVLEEETKPIKEQEEEQTNVVDA